MRAVLGIALYKVPMLSYLEPEYQMTLVLLVGAHQRNKRSTGLLVQLAILGRRTAEAKGFTNEREFTNNALMALVNICLMN